MRAHSRRSDPVTSSEAANAITLGINAIQRAVMRFAVSRGEAGFSDLDLEEAMRDHGPTYRTRRHELVGMGLIEPSGIIERREGDTRRRVLWRATARAMGR